MKVIGIKHLTGIYQDRTYDNYNLYCTYEKDENVIYGVCPNVVKVKSDILYESVEDPLQLADKEIDCYYDSYKNVVKILIKE